MGKQVIVGAIGAGRIGKLHIKNITHTLPHVKIKKIVDIREEETKKWAKDIGLKNTEISNNPENIFSDKEIQAVLIFSSTDTHSKYIQQAANAGKDIFCEKPIDYDLNRIKETLEVVKKANVKLMIGFNRRFDHNFRRVRQAVIDGDVGKPHIVKITSRDPAPPPIEYIKVSGGLFFDMTIHDWDMARYLAGEEVVEVFASGTVLIDPKIGEVGDIDTAVATLKYRSGAYAIIDNSRQATYGYDQRVEVFGSKGAVWADNDRPNTVIISTDESSKRDKIHYFFLERYMQSYADEMIEFFNCLEKNKEPSVGGIDGLNAVLIAMAAKKSLEEKRPVKISEIQ